MTHRPLTRCVPPAVDSDDEAPPRPHPCDLGRGVATTTSTSVQPAARAVREVALSHQRTADDRLEEGRLLARGVGDHSDSSLDG